MDKLLAALEHDLPQVAGRLINRISVEGRRNFLGRVISPSARALYNYLAKGLREGAGRQQRRPFSPCEWGVNWWRGVAGGRGHRKAFRW